MIDVLELGDALDQAARDALLAELKVLDGSAATLLGRDAPDALLPRVRRATRIAVPAATSETVTALLLQRIPRLEAHFGLRLERCEEPQFLRYRTGDFFVPHQDGNTPLIYDQSRFRRLSAVIFLSRQSDDPAPGTYGGGSLVLHGPYSGPERRVPVAAAPGTLVAFRAETTHEVTPVTHGERFTIVSWFR